MKRNLSRMFRTGVAAAAALLCAMPFQAAAEDYPSRPITLIMPFGAGNAPDTAARIIGDYLQRKHNITLLITSKPGGSGIPATLETVRARPDGYTISLTSANVLTVVPQYKKCGFTYKDLAPVAQVNVFTMAGASAPIPASPACRISWTRPRPNAASTASPAPARLRPSASTTPT